MSYNPLVSSTENALVLNKWFIYIECKLMELSAKIAQVLCTNLVRMAL